MRHLFRWGLPALLLVMISSIVWAVPPQQESPDNLFQAFLIDLRADMELLADRVFGGGTRPDAWTGNTDFRSDNMLADLWFDSEVVANEIYGEGLRPRDWIGASTRNADLVSRNVRHDLELLGNEILGEGARPQEWKGGPLLYTCSRSLMNIVYLLNIGYGVVSETPETVRVYCETVEAEVTDVLLPEVLGGADQLDNVPSLILAVRGDLERLADELLGVNIRPEAWIRNVDIESTSLAADIFTDLEVLADIRVGSGARPVDWIGSAQGTQAATFRNLRHDLELLTDITLGAGVRPFGWQGDAQIFRCEPILQNLVFLAERTYNYSLPEDGNGREFCDTVSRSVNFVVENPPLPDAEEELAEIELRYSAESQNAFAYLDQAAVQYMGVMPWNTPFRAWYRNFGESTMMFVSGDDFAVFIDRRWTTLSEEVFRTLPTLEGIKPLTFCDANWCNGPAPTPTPTGSGPLLDIINSGTPPASVGPEATADADTGAKQLVSWNHIRVNYLLQRSDVGRVQVTLEICREPNQIICEPVTSVFDNTFGQAVPFISQFNGLGVYELPYGYSTNFIIEGPTLYSQDIWLNDPTIDG